MSIRYFSTSDSLPGPPNVDRYAHAIDTGRRRPDLLMQSQLSAVQNIIMPARMPGTSHTSRILETLTADEKTELWERYKEQLFCLSTGENIDVRGYKDLQRDLRALVADAELRGYFLRSLNEMGYLAPGPELLWKVNRSMKQCSSRLRFDIEKFLGLLGEDSQPKTIVELGVGSGAFKAERWGLRADGSVDVGISDKLYYQIDEFLERAINWCALASAGADLTGPENKEKRAALCLFIYKVLVIEEGKTAELRPPYDQQVLSELTRDPNALVDILHRKGGLLGITESVPDEVGENDGTRWQQAIYPGQDPKPSDPAMWEALNLLASVDAADQYLRIGKDKVDAYEILPVDPANVLFGDFSNDLQKLKKGHVDFAVGVRSTVYVQDKNYASVLCAMADTLSEDGFYIDDSVRHNFGAYYRIEELKQVQRILESRNPPIYVRVIVGKGFDNGEEKMNVPLSVIMTPSRQKLWYAEECISADKDCMLVSPDRLSPFTR